MEEEITGTENKIVIAARKIFVQKGYDGARMQEIADEAGINKALLHYYFRSKEKLFNQVFLDLLKDIITIVNDELSKNESIIDLIEGFVTRYYHILMEKPYLPNFVLHELNRDPNILVTKLQQEIISLNKFQILVEEAVEEKVIINVLPLELLVDMLSLCVFPFIAKPLIKGFLLKGNESDYQTFVHNRIPHVISMLKRSMEYNS